MIHMLCSADKFYRPKNWANNNYSNCSQSCVIFVEDDIGGGAVKLPIPESNVSQFVVTDTALLLLLNGLEFLAFRLSSVSWKFWTRRT